MYINLDLNHIIMIHVLLYLDPIENDFLKLFRNDDLMDRGESLVNRASHQVDY